MRRWTSINYPQENNKQNREMPVTSILYCQFTCPFAFHNGFGNTGISLTNFLFNVQVCDLICFIFHNAMTYGSRVTDLQADLTIVNM